MKRCVHSVRRVCSKQLIRRGGIRATQAIDLYFARTGLIWEIASPVRFFDTQPSGFCCVIAYHARWAGGFDDVTGVMGRQENRAATSHAKRFERSLLAMIVVLLVP